MFQSPLTAPSHVREVGCIPEDPQYNLPPPDPRTMSVKELKAAVVEAGLASEARGFTEKSEFVDLLLANQ